MLRECCDPGAVSQNNAWLLEPASLTPNPVRALQYELLKIVEILK